MLFLQFVGMKRRSSCLLAGLLVSVPQLINGEFQLYKSWYMNNKFLHGAKFEVAAFLPGPKVCGVVQAILLFICC